MVAPVRTRAPGPGERLLAVVTLFLLAYSEPSQWLRQDNTGVATGDSTVIIIFAALFAIALTRLVGNWGHVTRAVKREPFLLVFVALPIASTAWSTVPGDTFRRSIALLLTTFFGYYLVVRFPLREIIRLAAIALAAGTILNYVWIIALPKYGITQVTTEAATNGDWSGVFLHKNALGQSALVNAMLFVFAWRMFPRLRVVCLVFAALNVGLIVGARSQTALVGFCLLMILMALFTGLRAHRTLYGGVAFGLFGTAVVAAAFVTTNLASISESLGRDATLTGRTQLWQDVLHEVATRPLLGFGWSGFWTGAADGPSRYVLERNLWHPPDAHNAVLELMVNIGIIGAGLFCLVFFRGLVRAVGHVRRQPTIAGLFPLVYLSFVLLQSVTERGVVSRDISWALFVVAIVSAARDRAARTAVPTGPRHLPTEVATEARSQPVAPAPSPTTESTDDSTIAPTRAVGRRSSFTVRGAHD